MKITKILRDSLRMLSERPELFIPRIISSGLSSVLIVLWMIGWLGTFAFMTLTPILAILGSFTLVMVSSMVEKEEDEMLLSKGLHESLGLWKQVLGFTGLTMIIAFINSLALSIGLVATLTTGEVLYAGIGAAITLLFLIAASFGLYFMPISLIKERKLFKSVDSAVETSNRNRKEVIILILFSLAVLGISSVTTGYLRDIGLTLFFAGRMISSVVGTYLLVISPKYYLSERDQE